MQGRSGAGDTGWRWLIQRYCAEGRAADGELSLWVEPPTLPLSILNPGQPRPQGAPFYCPQVSTFASLLSEFWLNLNAKEKSLQSKLSQWKVLSPKPYISVQIKLPFSLTCKHVNVFCYTTHLLSVYFCSHTIICLFLHLHQSLQTPRRISWPRGLNVSGRSLIWDPTDWGSNTELFLGRISLHGHRAGACKSISTYCCWSTSARRRPPWQSVTGVGGQSCFLVTYGH